MPRKAPPLPIPSVPVLRSLYKAQQKPPSVHAPSKKQLDHEYRQQKQRERPRLPPVYTKYFRLGHKEVHFPKVSITLLRPFSTEYNPYRARFRVPSNFNKFDLRDYLHNVYGLTVKKVYSSLTVNRFSLTMQKLMTVEMDQPFMYPEMPDLSPWKVDANRETERFMDEARRRYGASSQENKVYKGFGGIAQQKFPTIKPYMPKKAVKALKNQAKVVDVYTNVSVKAKAKPKPE
ncbi:hypothetical protein BZA70DRAFT_284537 [Myxozyma melibiosi]|uniref:Large ribosomal subunit protein uL23m n=1 Tax=Myxozyma melibiosi TaxID=54550 RepID=A0ABR1EZG3_9ASCO